MKYQTVTEGIFLSRPNRFIAKVLVEEREEICHVKNTGRCKELLIAEAKVYLAEAVNPNRKTKYDLIAVEKGNRLINLDSQAPNRVFSEWAPVFFGKDARIYPEKTYRKSRFDFFVETSDHMKHYVEVKGVTLEENGVVRFPDAPTLRGVKHIGELCKCVEEGYGAYLFFVVQMADVSYFTPNRATHPAFADALEKAKKAGVQIYALDCKVTPDSMEIKDFVDIILP